jgi:hypothetical protein
MLAGCRCWLAADAGWLPMPAGCRCWLAADLQGRGHSGGRLFWGGVKEFADGSLGSRTALMWEPYSDDGASSGIRVAELEVLRESAAAADGAGLQVGPTSRAGAGGPLPALQARLAGPLLMVQRACPSSCASGSTAQAPGCLQR